METAKSLKEQLAELDRKVTEASDAADKAYNELDYATDVCRSADKTLAFYTAKRNAVFALVVSMENRS